LVFYRHDKKMNLEDQIFIATIKNLILAEPIFIATIKNWILAEPIFIATIKMQILGFCQFVRLGPRKPETVLQNLQNFIFF